MTLDLPYPPSVNMYWRHTRAGNHYISGEGKAYRKAVYWLVRAAKADHGSVDRLEVSIDLYPPDARRRDLDNVLKVLLDSLEHADVYKDDSQIDSLHVRRCEKQKPGRCVVHVEALTDEP